MGGASTVIERSIERGTFEKAGEVAGLEMVNLNKKPPLFFKVPFFGIIS